MLVLPLWGICATALLTIFMPFIKGLHEPSISLLQDFSLHVFDNVKYHLGITEDPEQHVTTPPLMTLSPVPSLLPRVPPSTPCGYFDCPLEEANDDLILVSIVKSAVMIPETEKAVSVVTPFSVKPPRYTPSPSSAVASSSPMRYLVHSATPYSSRQMLHVHDAQERIRQWAENHRLDLLGKLSMGYLAVFFSSLAFLHIRARKVQQQRAAAAAKAYRNTPKSTPIKDLSGTKIVLLSQNAKPYLDEFMQKIEEPQLEMDDSHSPIDVVQYICLDKEDARLPSDILAIRRWTVSKSEFDSKYLRASATDSAKPSYVVGRPSAAKNANNETDTQNPSPVTAAAVVESLAQLSAMLPRRHDYKEEISSYDDELPVPGQDCAGGEPSGSTVVSSDVHVEGTPVANPPSGMAPDEPVIDGKDLPLITLSPPSPCLEPGEEDSVPRRRRRRCRMGQRQRRKKREAFEALRRLEEGEAEAEENENEEQEAKEEIEGEGEGKAPVGGEQVVV